MMRAHFKIQGKVVKVDPDFMLALSEILWEMQRSRKNVYDGLNMLVNINVTNIYVNSGLQNVCCSVAKVVAKHAANNVQWVP